MRPEVGDHTAAVGIAGERKTSASTNGCAWQRLGDGQGQEGQVKGQMEE